MKLSDLEDTFSDSADKLVNYLQRNCFTRAQQIHWMLSQRTAPLGDRSFEISTDHSIAFRILPESDSKFDSFCDYLALIIYSYKGQHEFHLNGRDYQRGDILIKNMKNLCDSASIYEPHRRFYHIFYKSLINQYFQNTSYEGLLALGIAYSEGQWKFDALVIGSDTNKSLFSLDERLLLEMYILSWTKDIHGQGFIRHNAWKMLNEQFSVIKKLLNSKLDGMEQIRSAELQIAIQIFEYEIEDEIKALFQV